MHAVRALERDFVKVLLRVCTNTNCLDVAKYISGARSPTYLRNISIKAKSS